MRILDLRVGNPLFINYRPSPWLLDSFTPEFKTSREYQTTGSPVLKDSIRKLHNRFANAVHEDKFIVIGNGATQLLHAALYAVNKTTGLSKVTATSPYYIRFPKIAQNLGLEWVKEPSDQAIQIVTTPNNPDGKLQHSTQQNTIYDLCYNWIQYLDLAPIQEDEDIMLFSLAKALGYASTRIGWAIVKDPNIATLMEEYIELTTSGVSIDAQREAYTLIEISMVENPSPYLLARFEMTERWKKIRMLKDLPFEVISNCGMFLLCKGDDLPYYFRSRNILYINGEDFGCDSSYGRINLGCSNEDFDELIKRLT